MSRRYLDALTDELKNISEPSRVPTAKTAKRTSDSKDSTYPSTSEENNKPFDSKDSAYPSTSEEILERTQRRERTRLAARRSPSIMGDQARMEAICKPCPHYSELKLPTCTTGGCSADGTWERLSQLEYCKKIKTRQQFKRRI